MGGFEGIVTEKNPTYCIDVAHWKRIKNHFLKDFSPHLHFYQEKIESKSFFDV